LHKWNGGTWGPKAPRKPSAETSWKGPVAWDRKAEEGRVGKDGSHWLVFAGDLCDIFDPRGPKKGRDRMWELFRATPHLTWQVLTKRPENFAEYLPADWGEGYENVWLGVTVENREDGYPRIDLLRQTPAKVRFLSCEPLLEELTGIDLTGIHWVIVGGESGNQARPFDIKWARALKAACKKLKTTFFFKQLGAAPVQGGEPFPILHSLPNEKRDAHGVSMENFPDDLKIQTWPKCP
jgi:protein gp37